jgi:guanosine-3',5'-bis(diphosphate) 3'-pyrophosphohydrolase
MRAGPRILGRSDGTTGIAAAARIHRGHSICRPKTPRPAAKGCKGITLHQSSHRSRNEAGVKDVIVLMAALLHDTIEDTDTTAEELKAHFGSAVAVIVVQVTDDKKLKKAERKRQQVLHASSISDQAKLVKLADTICNLRDLNASPPADWGIERKREYFDWAKQVVDQLRGVHPRLEALFDAQYARRP